MIKLGDEVQDMVTGFSGIAISKHIYLQGCTRVTIQPPIDEEGKLPKVETFDEPQLIVLNVQKVKKQAAYKDPGGPEKYLDSIRPLGY